MTKRRLVFLGVLGALAVGLIGIGATSVTPMTENRAAFEQTDIVVGTTLGDSDDHCCEIPVTSWPCGVAIEVENTHASVPLTDLGIQARSHASGAWTTLLNGTDWADSSIATLRWCSDSACNTLAAAGKVQIWLDVPAPCDLRVTATASSAGEIAVRGTVAARK